MKAFMFCCFCISAFTNFALVDLVVGGLVCLVFCGRTNERQDSRRYVNKRVNAQKAIPKNLDVEAFESLIEVIPATGLVMRQDTKIDAGGNLNGLTGYDIYS